MAKPGNSYTKNIGMKIDRSDMTMDDIPIRKLSINNFLPKIKIDELYPIKYRNATVLWKKEYDISTSAVSNRQIEEKLNSANKNCGIFSK